MNEILLSSIPVNELRIIFSEVVQEQLNNYKPGKTSKQELTLLTRKDLKSKLGLSLVTIDRLTKKGTLKGYRIAGRIRFKLHEVEQSLTEIQGGKYKRL